MRVLKFIGAFLLTAFILLGFVVGWNWKPFNVFFENRKALTEGSEWVTKTTSLKGLSEFMGENPKHTSLVSRIITVPDSGIYYREEVPRIMGTTANFFILLEYARQMDEGTINPDLLIPWNQISRYQLPDVEESIHEESFNAAVDRGWIQENSISLMNALRLLPQYNDLALADYLWWQIDPGRWQELSNLLELEITEMPLPYSGLYQAISPGLREMDNSEIIKRWQKEENRIWRDHVIQLSSDFSDNESYRASVLNYMTDERLGNTFMEERNAMILFPKASGTELTNLLQNMWADSLINQNVSETIRDLLDWPMNSQPRIDEDFETYGALYDNRLGLMNGIDFGKSAYTGDVTVQALFLDRLPIAFWFHASGGHMHQDFMQRLIYDPALINQVNSVIDQSETDSLKNSAS